MNNQTAIAYFIFHILETNAMDLIELLATKRLVIEFQDKVATVPTNPTDPNNPPPPVNTTYDLTTNSVLLESYNKRLDPTGEPEQVQLSNLGFSFGYVAPVDNFERFNSCYKWTGAIKAPVAGEYKFFATIKSAGFIIFNDEIIWSVDREQDTGSHSQFKVEFTRTLEAGKLYPISCLMVKQSGEHIFELLWTKPGDVEPSPVSTLYCFPPANWKDRLKTYIPAPPPPPPPTDPVITIPQPNWETYQSPDLAVRFFPEDNAWNRIITDMPVDAKSPNIIGTFSGAHLHPVFGHGMNGIPFEIVPPGTPKVNVTFTYSGESDVGPYPIPTNPVLESGGDLAGGTKDVHWIGISLDEMKIYEIFQLEKTATGWKGLSGAIFDLTTNNLRTLGYTSADAAGLPILPGLIRYDEVKSGKIAHALRVTVGRTRKAFILPATHWASSIIDENFPPMGCRIRLKQSKDISGYSPDIQVILQCLKDYGAFIADNGGYSLVGLCGTPDSRWSDDILGTMKNIMATDFEVVQMGQIITQV
jgi:hypothetical protein